MSHQRLCVCHTHEKYSLIKGHFWIVEENCILIDQSIALMYLRSTASEDILRKDLVVRIRCKY